jgi:hypothetical protein
MRRGRAARALLVCVALIGAASLVSTPASAQDARADAEEHFLRGLRLYEEGHDVAALAEFEAAYRAAPAWQVLYNIARVHERLGHAVEAADTYARVLTEGGASIEPAQRASIEAALREQRARIARVVIVTNVERAAIVVDGTEVATAPLADPLRVSAGEHVIEARAQGHLPARRTLRLAGGATETLRLELEREASALGSLRVRVPVPDVAIVIDGREVGRSPLRETAPVLPGEHVVEGRRRGYLVARDLVRVEPGQEAELELSMRRDESAASGDVARLRLALPSASFTLRIDGDSTPHTALEVPVGQHDLQLEVADRAPHRFTVRVGAGGLDYRPSLTWTAAARQRHVEGASLQRGIGIATAIGGVLVLAGGASVIVYNEVRQADASSRLEQARACEATPTSRECSGDYDLPTESAWRAAFETETGGFYGGGVGGIALGAALLGVGVAVALGAASESDIDRAASAQLRVGPSGVTCEGAF